MRGGGTHGRRAVLVGEVVEQREGPARHSVAVQPEAGRLAARHRRAVRARRVREHLRRAHERPTHRQNIKSLVKKN